MNKYILLTLLLVSSFSVKTQEVDLLFGSIKSNPFGVGINRILGETENGFFAIKPKANGHSLKYFLNRYDTKMDLVESHEIIFSKEVRHKKEFIESFVLNNEIILFMRSYDLYSDYYLVHMIKVSPNGVIKSVTEAIKVEIENTNKLGYINISLSSDSTDFLLEITPHLKKDMMQEMYFTILSVDEKSSQNIKVTFEYNCNDIEFSEFRLDPIGNIHILAKVKKAKKNKHEPDFEYKIYTYYLETHNLYEHQIDLGDNYISSVMLKVKGNNNLFCTGFYSNDSDEFMKGMLYAKLDINSKKLERPVLVPFSNELIEECSKNKRATLSKGIFNLKPDDLIFKDDGGFTLISEYYHSFTVATKDNWATVSHNEDIIVIDINNELEVNWMKRIPKFQQSKYNMFFGYVYQLYNNNLYIIYNDMTENWEGENTNNPGLSLTSKYKTIMVVITPEGNIQRNPLFSAKDTKTVPLMSNCYIKQHDYFVFVGMVGNKSRLLKIDLK